MPRRELIAESVTPDGERLTLDREGDAWVVRLRGETLMSSRQFGSEQAMVQLAYESRPVSQSTAVLIGGLGMGFTVRAALDAVGPRTRVTVVELLADVVRWNRGPLAACAGDPLDDPRVSLRTGDLLDVLADQEHQYDTILLDIDNGPESFTVKSNDRLYRLDGLSVLYQALRPGGVAVLWSAFKSAAFEKRLGQVGFDARSVTRRARSNVGKGARHTLFVASRPRSTP